LFRPLSRSRRKIVAEAFNQLTLPSGVEDLEPIELIEDDGPDDGIPSVDEQVGAHGGEDDELTIREDEVAPGLVALTVIQPAEGA